MNIKLVIEKNEDGYTGYPLGFSNGAIVGQGKTYSEALKSVEDSIAAFIEYYGLEKFKEHLSDNFNLQEVFIAETGLFV